MMRGEVSSKGLSDKLGSGEALAAGVCELSEVLDAPVRAAGARRPFW